MNKQDIVGKVLSMPFANDVILMHGASMVLHGVRPETSDIDCQIDLEKYPSLIVVGKACSDGVTRYEFEEFDFGDGGVREVPYVTIEGIKCQTLDSIVKDKIALGRKKDYDAIAEINRFRNNKK